MSVENKKHQLRSMLAGKSTAELEELLALEATDLDAVGENAEYISTILEVIAERESTPEQDEAMTEKAWEDFQEYYKLRKQEQLQTDKDEEAPRDHRRKTEYRQQTPGGARVLRYVLIAAVLTVDGQIDKANVYIATDAITAQTLGSSRFSGMKTKLNRTIDLGDAPYAAVMVQLTVTYDPATAQAFELGREEQRNLTELTENWQLMQMTTANEAVG